MRPLTASFVLSAASPAQFPRDGLPEVAFLGRSNVGKSSLLNTLVKSPNLARVSAQPGRTQLVNFFDVERALYLVDLPGYGYARVPQSVRRGWERLVASYLFQRAPLALCVFLLDARHEPTSGDDTLRALLDHERLPYVVAATKADKLGRGELARRRAELVAGVGRHAQAVLHVSARTRLGVEGLWKEIRSATQAHRARARQPA